MQKLKYSIPTIIWMAVIFYLSSRTPSQLHSLFPFIKNFNPGHLIAYFILGLVSYYSLSKTSDLGEIMRYPWMLIIGLIYGLSDEIHQHFVPGRMPDINDLVNDMIGVLVAVIVIRQWHKWLERKETGMEPQQEE